jgi:hypothetical protein
LVDGEVSVAEIGFVSFAEFRVGDLTKLLYQGASLGYLLLAFVAFLS